MSVIIGTYHGPFEVSRNAVIPAYIEEISGFIEVYSERCSCSTSRPTYDMAVRMCTMMIIIPLLNKPIGSNITVLLLQNMTVINEHSPLLNVISITFKQKLH